ncbi:MAG: ABC transporter ATP-binding protein [Acidobacteriota bacterium]
MPKTARPAEGRPISGRPFSSSGTAAPLRTTGLVAGYPGSGGPDRALTAPLDLELRRGQLICLLGPNGAGKSTLLRTLAGVQAALDGDVELEGQPLDGWPPRQRARRLAVVLTDGDAPLGMPGLEMVRLGRQPHSPWTGRLRRQDHEAVERALEAVDGVELAPRPLGQLSDGERQKLLLARALAQEADLLLLDEITAFLDVPRRLEIFRILRRLAHAAGKSVLLTTHDVDLALRSADRIWLMSQDGLLTGAPESLVLNGALGRAFAGRGVEFDRDTGRFHLPTRRRGTVQLHGDGRVARWTAHGLERLGFQVVHARSESPGEGAIQVVVDDSSFVLTGAGGEAHRCQDLDSLLDAATALRDAAR